MYVQVRSVSGEAMSSRGKTAWVNTEDFAIKLARSSPEHLGAPAWHIDIRGTGYEVHADGTRGGEYKSVTRRFEIALTPGDVAKIVNLALREGLVRLSAKVATRKGVGS